MELFVPGRICLFGEHSDWAGGYRRINGEIGVGYTLITGTNQGIHATVTPHPSKLVFRSTLEDGSRQPEFEIPMDRDALLAEAQGGGFHSYVCGVAYQVLTHYQVKGLVIDNHKTDLPIKKGLSSSAAVCVLTARAFNRIYDLKMTVRGEMEFAYLGEITTPSRCGRMDQGCAYGDKPILMTFDGERTDVRELTVGKDLHLVIVDLKQAKDTRKILARLNSCYPFADNDLQQNVQHYLGPVSADITHRAKDALGRGDAETLGQLMREAQQGFRTHCAPACPSELNAPHLHKLLDYPPIQPHILGGKGVGSQGDGTAQFLTRDKQAQQTVIDIISNDLGLECLELTISAGRKVAKALIPAAGYGTRLYPATKSLKKEFFPVLGHDGRMKPAILEIVEEARDAGIQDIGIIIQPRDNTLFHDFFNSPPPIEHYNKLSQADREYSDYLQELGRHITLINQESQEGFGHAVHCGRDFIGNEPFLLMLGDHLYSSTTPQSCVAQLIKIFEQTGKSTVGLKPVPAADVRHFGCVTGVWNQDNTILNITAFAEKPDPEYARQHLKVENTPPNTYLSLFGLYILTPQVFDLLQQNIQSNRREKNEFQLTTCLDTLRQVQGFTGHIIQGDRHDIGNPKAYRQTMKTRRP